MLIVSGKSLLPKNITASRNMILDVLSITFKNKTSLLKSLDKLIEDFKGMSYEEGDLND